MEPKPSGHVIAIGDIHGCAEELAELLGKLPIRPDTTIVTLGDYIDRGPRSRQVISLLRDVAKRHKVVSLMGNHEQMLLEFLESDDPLKEARFIYNGGSATLASYADGHGAFLIPAEDVEFFHSLRPWYSPEGRFFYVHAGVPEVPLRQLDPVAHLKYALWARKEFQESDFPWERVIVHGHSPVHAVDVGPRRINVDTGCVYGGALSAVELPSLRIWSVPRSRSDGPARLTDGTQRQSVRFRGAIPLTLHHDHGAIEAETLDYSDIGLLVQVTDPDARQQMLYVMDEPIEGTLGVGDTFETKFTGVIVRCSPSPEGYQYGIALTALGGESIERP